MNNFLMVVGSDYKEFKYLCGTKYQWLLKL